MKTIAKQQSNLFRDLISNGLDAYFYHILISKQYKQNLREVHYSPNVNPQLRAA